MSYMLDSISRLSAEIASLTAQLAAANERATEFHRRAQQAEATVHELVSRLEKGGPVHENVRAILMPAYAEDLRKQLAAAKQENDELRQTFDLQWDANMRGIKAWQAANPGNDLVWPDQAKLVEWLLDRLAEANKEIARLRKIEAAAQPFADALKADRPLSRISFHYWKTLSDCYALAGEGGG